MNGEQIGMFFDILAGLGVFLLGMKYMSEGMQAVAGDRLRSMINAVTNRRIVACGVGVFITCLIQSSSITTVMTVGMVNAGLMKLTQALGVIMGANIGTTITGWLLVLKIGKFGLPIMGVSAFFFLFSRNERVRYTALVCLGLGLVFFGLHEMKEGFKPLRYDPAFTNWFSRFRPDTYFGVIKCCLAGALLTAVVQSSSATLGITIGLAQTGIIPYETAAALVLGENIGTTITAWFASLGAGTTAKRAAYGHIVFNLLGAAWITAIFAVYIKFVLWFVDIFLGIDSSIVANYATDNDKYAQYVTTCIASTHTIFNIVNVAVFLPMTGGLAKLLTRIVPDRKRHETPHLTYLDVRMLDTPAMGIQQSKREIVRMSETAMKMMGQLRACMESRTLDEKRDEKVFHREHLLDIFQKEVMQFLSQLLRGQVPRDVMREARAQMRMADEYESIGDYMENILKLHIRMIKGDLDMTEQGRKDILRLEQHVREYLELVHQGVIEDRPEVLSKAKVRGDGITHAVREIREAHMTRVENEEVDPLMSLIYMDMLNAFRRIKDHAFNIAEVVAGEK